MSRYREKLPQLSGGLFLADAGIETDLIFNHGIEIREFAAHTLLPDPTTRTALADYFRGFLSLAGDLDTGFVLDSQTWKAHMHWAGDLGASEQELQLANRDSVSFIAGLRDEFSKNSKPVVLNGVIGPTADAYAPEGRVGAESAERYHGRQLGWLAETEVDMVTGVTFPRTDEAVGLVRAAQSVGLPVAISFTVETDGCLPTGRPLGDAINMVDDSTAGAAAYFMVNCAHPDHFFHVFNDADWTRRVIGLRCNASRLSHEELDACEVLDDGDPVEFAAQYRDLLQNMPWINVLGGCCGSDLRHVTNIARALTDKEFQ
jgi:homocysteine S-methyltransferase